jgi:hypothetical protein
MSLYSERDTFHTLTPREPREEQIEQACEVMHDAYENAAVTLGWTTNVASRKPWADVPEANKATMRVAVGALLEWLGSGIAW